MQTTTVPLWTAVQHPAIAHSWEAILLRGAVKNRKLYLDHLLKLNFEH